MAPHSKLIYDMIQLGNTVVIKNENGTLDFYWLCDSRPDSYVFFSWFGNLRRPSSSDYLRVSKGWFDDGLTSGAIEIYGSLPMEKYGEIFEKQAKERNR